MIRDALGVCRGGRGRGKAKERGKGRWRASRLVVVGGEAWRANYMSV